MVALSAALASAVGLLSPTGRGLAARGLPSALGVLIPAAAAFFAISFLWS